MNPLNNLFKESFELLRNNMVLIQPFILFFIVLGLISLPIGNNTDAKSMVVLMVCTILAGVVFNSGWFNMFYKCIKTPPNPNLTKAEQAIKSIELFKEFFPGVALYFIPMLLGSLIFYGLHGIIIFIVISIGLDQIGIPAGITYDEMFKNHKTAEEVNIYLNSLPKDTLLQLNKWTLIFFLAIPFQLLLNYLTMFWAQSIIFLKVNPTRAYLESFKLIIKNPLTTFIISFSFAVTIFASMILSVIPFIILKFIGLFLFILAFTYFNLVIFKYIEKQKIDNNSGTNGIREN